MRYEFSKILPLRKLLPLLAIVAVLAASAFFMANVVMPAGARFVSPVNVVLLALPSLWATRMWLGRRDALLLWVVIGIYALIIETIALLTGFPYGKFAYSDLIGYKLFAVTPWTVSLAWTPLVLGAWCVAAGLAQRIAVHRPTLILLRSALTVLFLVCFDLVVDPGAVRVGFWAYAGGGAYYGVPLSNFAGWLLSGMGVVVIVETIVSNRTPLLPVPVQLVGSSFFVLGLWTAVCGFAGLWLPFAIGSVILGYMAVAYLRDYYSFADMIVYADDTGRPIGTGAKLAAHNDATRLHKAFSVFLFDKRGALLLQQRALHKKTWPGVWSNSCCGHVMLHESVMHAARRRVRDELGVGVRDLRIVLPDFRYRAEKDGVVENELCPVLVGRIAADPRPARDEVNDVRWVSWSDLLVQIDDPSNDFSPWAREEVELLAANYGLWGPQAVDTPLAASLRAETES